MSCQTRLLEISTGLAACDRACRAGDDCFIIRRQDATQKFAFLRNLNSTN